MKEQRKRALHNAVRRLDTRTQNLKDISNRLSWIRLVVGVGIIFLTIISFQFFGTVLGWAVLLISITGFVMLVRHHNRVDTFFQKYTLLRNIKQDHLARMEVDWSNISQEAMLEPTRNHPFNLDLNITGKRSLHRIINTAATQGGRQLLADWLLQPIPNPDETERRQKLVRELQNLNGFRDKIRLNAHFSMDDDAGHWTAEKVLRWLEINKSTGGMRNFLIVLSVGASINLTLFVLWLFTSIAPLFLLTFILYFGSFIFSVRFFKDLVEEADNLQSSLETFVSVLHYIENFTFRPNTLLENFCGIFQKSERRPSKVLNRIAFIAGAAANSQRSQIGWLVVNALVPWDLYFAWRLENLKSELQHTLRDWLQKWYELEALSSLANFAYLNPDAVYPELVSNPEPPEFYTEQIGHPLIHPAQRVCNDFSFKDAGDVVLITGSNMSGKSTFLRTLGVNLVLAYTGAPVIADSLRTTPLRLFTCIQISDSLSDGISYFYAEVKRLKRLLAAYQDDHQYPLFFLIDEIFRGTNNRERLIGSRAVIRALTQGTGFGAIATHDLELTSLEDEIPHISNFHFREHIAEGKLEFDYTLRDGPCPTTNALKIMQHEGLPVD